MYVYEPWYMHDVRDDSGAVGGSCKELSWGVTKSRVVATRLVGGPPVWSVAMFRDVP